ncbi:MAG: hypothetical protein GY765_30620 [bacterium]|nr:hypothetical protein [bacterium]
MKRIVLYEEDIDLIRRKGETTALLDYYKIPWSYSTGDNCSRLILSQRETKKASNLLGLQAPTSNLKPSTCDGSAATFYFVKSDDVNGFAVLLTILKKECPVPSVICIEELRDNVLKRASKK